MKRKQQRREELEKKAELAGSQQGEGLKVSSHFLKKYQHMRDIVCKCGIFYVKRSRSRFRFKMEKKTKKATEKKQQNRETYES